MQLGGLGERSKLPPRLLLPLTCSIVGAGWGCWHNATHTPTHKVKSSQLCVPELLMCVNIATTQLQTVKQHAHVPFAEHLRAALRHSAEFFTVCVWK